MRGRLIDMSGRRCGSQQVLGQAGFDAHGQALWRVQCDCGSPVRAVQGSKLRTGESTSCGCMKPEKCAAANVTHGASARGRMTPEYRAWQNMIFRCENPSGKSWPNYGARGIRVCERWRDSFENFLADVGPKPSARHEIDRVDNAGNYEPGNVRWATHTTQARNKRSNHYLEARGRRLLLVDWARELGVHPSVILGRLKLGWSEEDAVTQPVFSTTRGLRALTELARVQDPEGTP